MDIEIIITKLLNMGNSFAFVAKNYLLADIVFYHIKLNSYVAVFLKNKRSRNDFNKIEKIVNNISYSLNNKCIGLIIYYINNEYRLFYIHKDKWISSYKTFDINKRVFVNLLPENDDFNL